MESAVKAEQLILVILFFFCFIEMAHAEAPYDLAQKYGCMACHSATEGLIGPSFKAIAIKYRGDPDGKKKLIAKLKNGGPNQGEDGIWGRKIMPPFKDEIKNQDHYAVLVDWVLSH
jgi:cytochrome c